jgi:hypothetical protein
MRWDNEVNFSIRLKENLSSKNHSIIDNKIIYVNDKTVTQFYPKEFGHEFEVVLYEKPKSNIIEFTLKSKGLDFFFQPELTKEEIERGDLRPENVIGSYAVYHKTKANNNLDKNYYCGKFCHIYRPESIDSLGKKSWCDLFIDSQNEIATITIPQKFLDEAVYPVTIDPEFGYHTIGASETTWGATYVFGQEYACSETGTANFISAYVKKGWASQAIQYALYTIDASAILKASTGSASCPAAFDWTPSNINNLGSLTAQTYRICFNTNAGGNVSIKYDALTVTGKYKSLAFGTWTTPLSSWTGYNNIKCSIYVDYTGSAITVGNTLQIIYNIRKTVGNTTQLIWNVRTTIGNTLQTIWNVKNTIGNTLQVIWNTRAVVGNTLQIIYNVGQNIGNTLQMVYNVRKAVGNSTQLIWNVRQIVSDHLEIIWNVHKSVGNSLQLIWDVEYYVYYGTLYRPDGSVWVKEKLKALDKTENGFVWKDVSLYIPINGEWKNIDISG